MERQKITFLTTWNNSRKKDFIGMVLMLLKKKTNIIVNYIKYISVVD